MSPVLLSRLFFISFLELPAQFVKAFPRLPAATLLSCDYGVSFHTVPQPYWPLHL